VTEGTYAEATEIERGTSMASRLWDRIRSYNPNWGYGTEDTYDREDELEPYDPPVPTPGPQREIVVRFPANIEDVHDIALNLKRRQPIIVNLEKADNFQARRIVDFLSGYTSALDGHMQRVGDTIFLFTPRALGINSEDRSVLETSHGAQTRPPDGSHR